MCDSCLRPWAWAWGTEDPPGYTQTAREVFLPAGVAAAAAAAIFCARRSALLFARGAMVGACRLLGRGRGFAGLASFALPLLVADAVLAAVDTEGREAEVDGREVDVGGREAEGGGREAEGGAREAGRCVLGGVLVENMEVTRDIRGRDGVGWTDAAEGGREMEGRAELVPL